MEAVSQDEGDCHHPEDGGGGGGGVDAFGYVRRGRNRRRGGAAASAARGPLISATPQLASLALRPRTRSRCSALARSLPVVHFSLLAGTSSY